MDEMEMNPMMPGKEELKGKKFTACFSYLFWFTVIPMIYSSESKFIKHHANQGLVLAIAETIFLVATVIVSKILEAAVNLRTSLLVETMMILVFIGSFGLLSLLGIINVIRGKEKPLPTFGHIKLLK